MKHCGRLAVTSLWHLRLLLLLLSWPVVATLLSKEIYQRWAIYPSAPEVICHHGGVTLSSGQIYGLMAYIQSSLAK